MFSRVRNIFFLLIWISLTGQAQNCELMVSGVIVEHDTGESIAFASVGLKGTEKGTVSDVNGIFSIERLCGDEHVLEVSCVGYATSEVPFDAVKGDYLVVRLQKSDTRLEDVIIVADYLAKNSIKSQVVDRSVIQSKGNESLANLLEILPGVRTLKNGQGLSKPVVHGLFGNRLPILNNGIAQNGQQWGNDHSPEIDPLVANSLRILNGVDAIRYQGRSLGAMVLVEPAKINKERILNGSAAYYFESNGLGHGLNLQLQQSSPMIAWKINGSVKKRGDQHTADYFLTNTGVEEANVAIQLEKVFRDQWYLDAYLSSFNTQIGILRGSHIGNLTDLQEALEREVPFYTNPYFSYAIDAPRQTVHHHMAKLQARYLFDEDRWLSFTYAFQMNDRKEFDVRKSGRSDIPAMSLLQMSHYFDGGYASVWSNDVLLKTGVQFSFIDNTNNPETGILPLIPDYSSFEASIYSTITKPYERWMLELGARYDYQYQNVAAISYTVPREIVRYTNHFRNYKAAFDVSYELNSLVHWQTGLSVGSRSPEVNELYSNGLHQGVSGIEEGNPLLKRELGIKINTGVNGRLTERMQVDATVYYQSVDNYIYLEPQDEVRLTIRGAFPVFYYEQCDAYIFGSDFMVNYQFSQHLRGSGQYSYLRGYNQTDAVPLINMPSDNVYFSLGYTQFRLGMFENASMELGYQYVFKQTHLKPEQDYAAPPDAYGLVDFKFSVEKQWNESHLHLHMRVENVFNLAYRDYMNRMRYFANDVGRTVVLGLNLSF